MIKKNYLALFAKSFNWAGFFLPKNIYRDCSKLYTFCRVMDDLVDEKTDLKLRIEKLVIEIELSIGFICLVLISIEYIN